MSMLSAIKLNLSNKLKSKAFRRRFFKSQAQDDVAQQIRALRTKRQMRQVDLAKVSKMKQSAVSRVEQANYSRWTFTTLLRIAEALDARARIVLDAAEDVIAEYEQRERRVAEVASAFDARQEIEDAINSFPDMQLGYAQKQIERRSFGPYIESRMNVLTNTGPVQRREQIVRGTASQQLSETADDQGNS